MAGKGPELPDTCSNPERLSDDYRTTSAERCRHPDAKVADERHGSHSKEQMIAPETVPKLRVGTNN